MESFMSNPQYVGDTEYIFLISYHCQIRQDSKRSVVLKPCVGSPIRLCMNISCNTIIENLS